MNWTKIKREPFQRTETGMKATKNKMLFKIQDYTKGWSYEHIGWYVIVEDKTNDKVYNSCWNQLIFKEIEDAQNWCEEYAKTERP